MYDETNVSYRYTCEVGNTSIIPSFMLDTRTFKNREGGAEDLDPTLVEEGSLHTSTNDGSASTSVPAGMNCVAYTPLPLPGISRTVIMFKTTRQDILNNYTDNTD